MVVEECIQCEGKGKRIFHKGTSRQIKVDCPCCRGEGKRFVNGKTVKEIVEEV